MAESAAEIIAEALAEHPHDRTWSGENEARWVLEALHREGFRVERPDIEYGVAYPTPTGREFVVMRDKEVAVQRIKANPTRDWTLAMRDRAVIAGPWLIAKEGLDD